MHDRIARALHKFMAVVIVAAVAIAGFSRRSCSEGELQDCGTVAAKWTHRPRVGHVPRHTQENTP